jgi:hypothetical protein
MTFNFSITLNATRIVAGEGTCMGYEGGSLGRSGRDMGTMLMRVVATK